MKAFSTLLCEQKNKHVWPIIEFEIDIDISNLLPHYQKSLAMYKDYFSTPRILISMSMRAETAFRS